MLQIFSLTSRKFLNSIDRSESVLKKALSTNWQSFFPNLLFIKDEFALAGPVRSRGTSGRIDILAFNSKTKKFVVLELKRNSDGNIRSQASDYKDFIEDNFDSIYLSANQDYHIDLPHRKEISRENIEIILIAKEFTVADVNSASKSKDGITLIKYDWIETDLMVIQYLNNEPQALDKKEKRLKNDTKPPSLPIKISQKKVSIEPEFVDSLEVTYILRSTRKDVLACGQKLSDGQFNVFKGSTVSNREAPGFSTDAAKAFADRRQLEKNGTINSDRAFTKDYTFNSISLAAKIILGGSDAGRGWTIENISGD